MKKKKVIFCITLFSLIGAAGILSYLLNSDQETGDLFNKTPVNEPNKETKGKINSVDEHTTVQPSVIKRSVKPLEPSAAMSRDEMKREIDALISLRSFEKALLRRPFPDNLTWEALGTKFKNELEKLLCS